MHLVYHGLNLEQFPVPVKIKSDRDGSDKDDPIRLITVGRAVEKKGLDVLLKALSRLPKNLHWRWTHIGGGPLLEQVKQQGQDLSLMDKLDFQGSQSQQSVLEAYRENDIFVLPCRIAADGDRDGLPNVIVEAQSQKLACISTPISGITELVEDGANGLLVEPDNAALLAKAIERLARNPDLRTTFGKEGRRRVENGFNVDNEITLLLDLLNGQEAGSSGVAHGYHS